MCGVAIRRQIWYTTAGQHLVLARAMPKDRRSYLPYSPELADRVCELMIEGVSLRKICAMSGMPSRRSIFNWFKDNEEFRERYGIARLMQIEYWSHEIIEIADDSSGDYIITEDGRHVVDHENINRARLRVDARKWLMSKLHPQRYGDRVTTDVTVRRDMRELSDHELLRIVGRSGEPDPGSEAEGEETVH
jgi:terminase small subunit-like protein